MTLLIKNAYIATSASVFKSDLLVEGQTISRIERDISFDGARVLEAEGKYLLPGGVDVHTHFDLDLGVTRASDTFFTGTVAAACGGTTTVVDHLAFGPPGCRLSHQIEVYHRLAEESVIDYAFHGVIQHVDEQVLSDMESLISRGITSYKLYLTYGHKLNDAEVMRVLARGRDLDLITCVHCENDAAIAFLTGRLLREGKTAPRYFPLSRPAQAEAEAVYRMVMLADMAGQAPLYIVHLSSELGLRAVRSARERGQRNLLVETCPQYLLLDDSRYMDDPAGLKYVMSPPLRTPDDNRALWRGLADREIDSIATDHCPFFFETQKKNGIGDFSRCPGGAPGVELRMPLMFSEGFMKDRLTLPDMVRLCCTEPAKIFGLHPQKGEIMVGADADLVLFDPEAEKTVTKSDLHENTDYTPYEGFTLRGAPVLTISRGEILVENNNFVGRSGRGRYFERKLFTSSRR